MSGIVKGTLLFISGAGLGALGSGFFFYRKSRKAVAEFEEKCSDEYAELRRELLSKQEYESETQKKSQGDNSIKTKATPRDERRDYTKYSKDPDSLESIIQRAENKLAEEEGPIEDDARKNKLKGPRIIKNEDFGNDRTLDREELSYYTGNGILANEADEIIDPDTAKVMIGDALTRFGFDVNDQDEICVRNEKFGYDYKITKIRSSYYE